MPRAEEAYLLAGLAMIADGRPSSRNSFFSIEVGAGAFPAISQSVGSCLQCLVSISLSMWVWKVFVYAGN